MGFLFIYIMKNFKEWMHKDNYKKITITCRDNENTLEELLNFIKKNGNVGHSFSIDADGEKFYWDGDGSDTIKNIEIE